MLPDQPIDRIWEKKRLNEYHSLIYYYTRMCTITSTFIDLTQSHELLLSQWHFQLFFSKENAASFLPLLYHSSCMALSPLLLDLKQKSLAEWYTSMHWPYIAVTMMSPSLGHKTNAYDIISTFTSLARTNFGRMVDQDVLNLSCRW